MTSQTSTNQLMGIAQRIREMREIIGYSTSTMAELLDIPEDQYIQYETGEQDLPFTFMHKCSMAFGVELTELLEGYSARLTSYNITRKGKAPVTASEDGITIQNMAAMFQNKLATPYWCTYTYDPELEKQPIHTVTHSGQEFDLVLSGALLVQVGANKEVLHEGDSIYYNSSTPHGMIAVEGKDCVFCAMVMNGEDSEEYSMKTSIAPLPPSRKLICEKFIETEEDDNGALQSIKFVNTEKFNFNFFKF